MGVTSHLSINLGELAGIELQPVRAGDPRSGRA